MQNTINYFIKPKSTQRKTISCKKAVAATLHTDSDSTLSDNGSMCCHQLHFPCDCQKNGIIVFIIICTTIFMLLS